MISRKNPYTVVVLIQLIYGGMFLLSKVAMDLGMNSFVFVFYRQAFATAFLVPLALYFEWKTVPRLSLWTLFKSFMLSGGVTVGLDMNGVATASTSATIAAAASSSLPAITFFLALLFGMEELKLRTSTGVAKLVGVVVCLGGSATLAFYKGPHLSPWAHHHHHLHHQPYQTHVSSGTAWIKGCFLMLCGHVVWAFWFVLQGKVMKCYPSKLLFTATICFLSSVQLLLTAIPFARDPCEWRLGWNIRLLSVAYCGVLVTGITFYLQSWVIEKRGPVFLAIFSPLPLIITIFVSALALREVLTLGSILGVLLLIVGLYSVLWGKSKEQGQLLPADLTSSYIQKSKSSELKEVAISST